VVQSAPELLEEHRQALRGTEEKDSVHVGHIKALVQHVSGKQKPDISSTKVVQQSRPLIRGGFSDQNCG